MPGDPVNTLIDLALSGRQGPALYDAYDACRRAMANARGQVLDVRANAVLDVLKMTLMLRPLSDDERTLLAGLRHADETAQA